MYNVRSLIESRKSSDISAETLKFDSQNNFVSRSLVSYSRDQLGVVSHMFPVHVSREIQTTCLKPILRISVGEQFGLTLLEE